MPLSVATMNSLAAIWRAALRMAEVEPMASARACKLAVVGAHNEFFGRHRARGLEEGGGRADGIGQRLHIGRAFGMDQHLGLGVLLFQGLELERLELVVHDA